MPLGDLQSFQINFTPNTALGKKHNTGRRPGYSREKERERDREMVRERKQLKGQERTAGPGKIDYQARAHPFAAARAQCSSSPGRP